MAPASARPRATSRPIPRVPPVTRAVFPTREKCERTGEEGLGWTARTMVVSFVVSWWWFVEWWWMEANDRRREGKCAGGVAFMQWCAGNGHLST